MKRGVNGRMSLLKMANKEKKAPEQQLPTCFDSTNSTVHVSGLRFSWNQKAFAKSCFEAPKFIIFCIFKI